MLFHQITKRQPIDKGWSGDKKYLAESAEGVQYLLRISPAESYDRRKRQFENMQRVAAMDVPMSRPIEFGSCEEGVYMLLEWIDGEDAEDVIPCLSPQEQYRHGIDAGKYLQMIHNIPAPEDAEPWASRFGRKIDRKIAMYNACPEKYENGDLFLAHIARARHLLSDRPQTYQHGDYHIGNMMVDRHGELKIIDFDRDDWGDPWEEFNRIVWCAQTAPPFAAGIVDGYFEGNVPAQFWDLLALYICSNTLSSLPWSVGFGESEIRTMHLQAQQILSWYDGMNTVVPSWYIDH